MRPANNTKDHSTSRMYAAGLSLWFMAVFQRWKLSGIRDQGGFTNFITKWRKEQKGKNCEEENRQCNR